MYREREREKEKEKEEKSLKYLLLETILIMAYCLK